MRFLTVVAFVLAACAPSASPSPSPSEPATTVPPSRTPASTTSAPATTPVPTASLTSRGTPIPLPSFATIDAPTGNVVWMLVAGTHLFRSTDRGTTTWEERTIPPQIPIGDIAFVNERDGWISSPVLTAAQCQSQSFAIWHTADGAATWDRVYQSDVTSDPMCKDSLAFADAQHGYLTLSSANGSPVIARTADAGRTWTRSKPLPDPPGFTSPGAGTAVRAGRVRAFGSILLVSVNRSGGGNGTRYVFRSTDGGATWTFAGTAPQETIEVSFVSETRWLQIEIPGQSKETTDAGASWHPFITDYGQAAPIAPQIVFGDTNVGYATVRGGLQRTIDGGTRWTQLRTPGTF